MLHVEGECILVYEGGKRGMRLVTVPITRWAPREELRGIESHLRSKHVPFSYEVKHKDGVPLCRIVRKMARFSPKEQRRRAS